MPASSAQPDPTGLAPSIALSTGTAQSEGAVALRPPWSLGGRLSLPVPRSDRGSLSARLALGSLVLCAVLLVMMTTAAPSPIVTHSFEIFPNWEAGPLHFLFAGVVLSKWTVDVSFSIVLVAMLAAYGLVLYGVRTLSLRAIVGSILVLHVILFLGPPTELNDVFNYLGYARLGALHGLNPYNHVIAQETWDPVYVFASWRHLMSPYGTLFSAILYPLAWMPLPVAYWVWKAVAVLASLGLLWLVYKCAQALGRDPRLALAFLALNPVYLVFALGGFHNDFVMLIPSMAAILLVIKGRERSAGAVLMLSVAIKFTTAILLPFLLVAAPSNRRRVNVLIGALMGAIPLAIISVALFGFSFPSVANQARLITGFSIPNLAGWALGASGGARWVLDLADLILAGVIVWLLLFVKGDWVARAGWATLTLVITLAWLMPWYVMWAAPLAALSTSTRLRRATLAMTVFVVLTFVPVIGLFLSQHGIDPMNSSVGQAAQSITNTLEQ